MPLAIPWLTQGDTTGPLELLWRESVTRGLTPFDHVQPWHFYFWNQFELLAPWSALLPAALALAWLRVREQARTRGSFSRRMYDRSEDRRRLFPLFGYLAIFLFFTLSGSRRTYYLLPTARLIVADVLLDSGPGWATRLRKWGLAALADQRNRRAAWRRSRWGSCDWRIRWRHRRHSMTLAFYRPSTGRRSRHGCHWSASASGSAFCC